MRIERMYRGIPMWLARDYLIEVGGAATEDYVVRGADWTATIRDGEFLPVGALRIGTIHVEFEGDEKTLPMMLAAFELKTIRAGG